MVERISVLKHKEEEAFFIDWKDFLASNKCPYKVAKAPKQLKLLSS